MSAVKKYCVVDMEHNCLFAEARGLKEAKRRAEEAARNFERVFGERRVYAVMTPEQEAAHFAKHHGGAARWDAMKRDRRSAPALAT